MPNQHPHAHLRTVRSHHPLSFRMLGKLSIAGLMSGIGTLHAAESERLLVGPFPDWLDVKTQFGAMGNGVADDTPALQAALNAVGDDDTTIRAATIWLPAGTYRITGQLNLVARNNANVIGADSSTTRILWDGPTTADSAVPPIMLRILGVQDSRFSRFTLDGQNRGVHGLFADNDKVTGYYTGRNEFSDLILTDVREGLTAGAADGAAAESTVLRCQFRHCTVAGFTTANYNALNWWLWDNRFSDCKVAARMSAGAFHAYRNVFERSTDCDIWDGNAGAMGIRWNTSVGSHCFLRDGGGGVNALQGNRIINPTTVTSIISGDATPMTLIDNVFRVPSTAREPVAFSASNCLAVGNVSTIPWPFRPISNRADPAVVASTDARTYLAGPVGDHTQLALLTDRDASTWFWDPSQVYNPNGWIQVRLPIGQFSTAITLALTNNPSPVWWIDPKQIHLLASADGGVTWREIDRRTGVTWTSRGQRRTFTITTPLNADAYRLVIDDRTDGIDGYALAGFELLDATGTDIMRTAGALLTGRTEEIDNFHVAEFGTRVVPLAEVSDAVPAASPSPRIISQLTTTVTMGTGDDAAAIQAAINLAAASSDTNPVIQMRKGIWRLKRTIVVPANRKLTITGDGMGLAGTRLEWAAAASGQPMMKLEGPSLAEIHSLSFTSGNNGSGVGDCLLIENADQVGGRVRVEHMSTDVSAESGIFNDGCERTQIEVHALNNGLEPINLASRGGMLAAAGRDFPGGLQVIGANTGIFSSTAGGRLIVRDIYSEIWSAESLRLTGTARITLDNGLYKRPNPPQGPSLRLIDFGGRATFLGLVMIEQTLALEGTSAGGLTGVLASRFDTFSGFRGPWISAGTGAGVPSVLASTAAGVDAPLTGGNQNSATIADLIHDARTQLPIALDPTPVPAGVTDVVVHRVSTSRGTHGLHIAAGPPDTTAPINLLPLLSGPTYHPTITSTTEPFAAVAISLDGIVIATIYAGADGSWSWSAASDLVAGEHQISTRATDVSGNSGSPSPVLIFTAEVPPRTTVGSDTGSTSGTTNGNGSGIGNSQPASDTDSSGCGFGSAIGALALGLAGWCASWRRRT